MFSTDAATTSPAVRRLVFLSQFFRKFNAMAVRTYYTEIDRIVDAARATGHQMSRHEAGKIVTAANPELKPETDADRMRGIAGIRSASHHGTSALDQFTEAIAAEQARRPGMSRADAAMAVNRKSPELRQRVLAEAR